MRAMILAAGYGTRLWPLTIDRAKPAIPFMNRPLVGYVASYLAGFGVREVAVNLHHRPESVQAALGDGERFGVKLHYVHEPDILGTSGALDNARTLLEGGTFVVINGKLATDIDLGAALDTHQRTRALATLIVRPNPARERYSTVFTRTEYGGASDSVRHITGFGPAPSHGSDNDPANIPLMFTGIQILEPRIFDFIPRGVFSHSTVDVYPKAWQGGERVVAHVDAAGQWHELSTVRRYLETSLHLMRAEGRDVETGTGSVIEPGAEVRESVLWENVHVEAGARVRRAVLGAGVRVRAGEVVEDAVVVRAELAEGEARPEKGLAGEFKGESFVAQIPR